MTKTPFFIGVGLQKSGTSWLFHNLNRHPQIWLPPTKELHYFDYVQGSSFFFKSLIKRNRKGFLKFKLDCLKNDFFNTYHFYHYFGIASDNWYQRQFRPQPNQISGEITPAYALLSEEAISHIKKINPDVKIVILLRDPIERAISQITMWVSESKKPINEKLIQTLLQSTEFLKYADTTAIIKNWMNSISESNIWIGYFDQIKQDPRELLDSLYGFLGVEIEYCEELINKRLNPSEEVLEEKWKNMIKEAVESDIYELNNFLDNQFTRSWLSKIK
jgi:hypothetical protein